MSADEFRQAFRPRARIVGALGAELISSDRVALVELVKNAYDADASHVLIRLEEPLEREFGAIWVVDDGSGMDAPTIEEQWLQPANSRRRSKGTSDRLHRPVLGEKGIGRFAAARLSDIFEVYTRQSDTEVHLRLDWREFESEQKFLDEVKVAWSIGRPQMFTRESLVGQAWSQAELPDLGDHGTALRLSRLRTTWSRDDIVALRSDLSRLIAPLPGTTTATDFEIAIAVPPAFEDLGGSVEAPAALQHPRYQMHADVRETGAADLQIVMPAANRIALKKDLAAQLQRPPLSGPFKFDLLVWDRDREAISSLASSLGLQDTQVRRVLDQSAGVSVYRDGFRVFPYGQPGNDWLGLDRRRIQNPTRALSNNQVFGAVYITRESNVGLKDQTNREGLVEGPAFDDLKRQLISAIAELEIRRFNLRPRKPSGPASGMFDGFQLDDIKSHAAQKHPSDKALLSLIEKGQERLEQGVERVREILGRYRRLASLGTLIDVVIHEGRQPIASILNETSLAIRDTDSVKFDRAASRRRLEFIAKQADVLALVFKKIEPLGGRRRGRPGERVLEEIISDSFDVFAPQLDELNISTDLPSTTTKVTADPAELQEVITNLILNSTYWLREVPKERRKIAVTVERASAHEVRILFADSGPGVPEDFRDRIFEPYFTARPDGFGLGLTLAGEIVSDYYDGSLSLVESPLGGAAFEIVLRKRV